MTQNGIEGTQDVVYTVTLILANNTGADITFDIDDLGPGTAESGLDYGAIPANAKITVLDGSTTGTFTVTVINDAVVEVVENLTLTISNPSLASVTVVGATALATITSDD